MIANGDNSDSHICADTQAYSDIYASPARCRSGLELRRASGFCPSQRKLASNGGLVPHQQCCHRRRVRPNSAGRCHGRRLGKSPAANKKAANISKVYRQQERHAKSWCASVGIHAISVSFQALVHRPDEILPQLAGFLGTTDELPAMRACIDPALHRARNKTSTAPMPKAFSLRQASIADGLRHNGSA